MKIQKNIKYKQLQIYCITPTTTMHEQEREQKQKQLQNVLNKNSVPIGSKIAPIPAETLSIIITTSPIKSHPCTQLIDDSITCINQDPSLSLAHIYIVCDGVKLYHSNKYKSGAITPEFLLRYNAYKQRLKDRYGCHPQRYTIIQRDHHHGFAGNIKHVMEKYAKTELVLIYQHDHIIDGLIDFPATVEMMLKHPNSMNYVTFMNKTHFNLVPKLCSHLPTRDYLLGLIGETKDTFNIAIDSNFNVLTERLLKFYKDKFGMGLLPMNFWYDKVHVARRDYYLKVIFRKHGNYDPHLGKNQKTISFVEDTFGHCMRWSIEEDPKRFEEYGAYLVWEKESVFYHNSGRAFLTSEQKDQIEKVREEMNKEKQESSSSEQSEEGMMDLQTMVLNDRAD